MRWDYVFELFEKRPELPAEISLSALLVTDRQDPSLAPDAQLRRPCNERPHWPGMHSDCGPPPPPRHHKGQRRPHDSSSNHPSYSYPQLGINNIADLVCNYQLDIGKNEMVEWLTDCHKGISGSELASYSCVVYFSIKVLQEETPKIIKALLPLVFHDQPNTAEMIMHSMDLIQGLTALLSPTQIAVNAVYQPYFILCFSLEHIQSFKPLTR